MFVMIFSPFDVSGIYFFASFPSASLSFKRRCIAWFTGRSSAAPVCIARRTLSGRTGAGAR